MALTLVRLRWALTLNQWRRSAFTLVMSVLGALYVLGLVVTVLVLLVSLLPGQPVEVRGPAVVLIGSAIVLGWLVIPPFVTGVDATLDPNSFVLFPVRPRTLITGLALSAFTTPVGLGTLLVLLGIAPAIGPNRIAGSVRATITPAIA